MARIKGTAGSSFSIQTVIRVLSIAAGAFDVIVTTAELDALIRSNKLDELRLAGLVPDMSWLYEDPTDATNDETALKQLQVATRWLYASEKPTVHMHVDLEGLNSLANLLVGANNTTANARAVVLAAAWNAHLAGVGTAVANGEHKAADAINTLPPNPTDLTSLKTWIGKTSGGDTGTAGAIIGHATQSGVHFTSDTGTGGTGFTMTVDPPVTQADCNNDLNDILAAMKTHFNLGTAVLPWADTE
jgi:hypothetical protein